MVTSTYQSVILLQFNSSGDSLSYADLSIGTGMNDEQLKGNLGLLCKQRVIDLKDEMYELNLGELSFCGGMVDEEEGAWRRKERRRELTWRGVDDVAQASRARRLGYSSMRPSSRSRRPSRPMS
jgi:hypothetical protein